MKRNGADLWLLLFLQIEEFIILVSACAKSKVYKTRELAARALVPLLTEKTVHTFIVELFEKIVPGRTGGLSFNALHGYMLQILEIIRSPQFTIINMPRSCVDSFLLGSRWIVENLQSNNDRSACFPLATAYVTALRELVKTGCEFDEMETAFDRVVPHLNISRLLKQRPGREVYEHAVAELFVTAMEHRSFPEKHRDESSESLAVTWNSILSHGNVQVQIAGWSGVAGIIDKTSNKKFIDIAIFVALNNIIAKILDPDLQDVVYDFLCTVLGESDADDGPFDLNSHSLNSLCSFVVTVLVSHMENGNSQESPSFMRLLGKAYGKLPQSYKVPLINQLYIWLN